MPQDRTISKACARRARSATTCTVQRTGATTARASFDRLGVDSSGREISPQPDVLLAELGALDVVRGDPRCGPSAVFLEVVPSVLPGHEGRLVDEDERRGRILFEARAHVLFVGIAQS